MRMALLVVLLPSMISVGARVPVPNCTQRAILTATVWQIGFVADLTLKSKW